MADIAISALPEATALDADDVLVGNEDGTTSRIPLTVLRVALELLGVPVTTSAAGTYSLAKAANAARVTRFTSGSAVTATLQTISAGGFAVGDVITIRQAGAGQVTVTPSSTVTINIPTGAAAKTRVQGSTIMLHCVDAASGGTWDITGDLAEA